MDSMTCDEVPPAAEANPSRPEPGVSVPGQAHSIPIHSSVYIRPSSSNRTAMTSIASGSAVQGSHSTPVQQQTLALGQPPLVASPSFSHQERQPRSRSNKESKYSSEEWESKKNIIRDLYVVEKRTLDDVQKIMATLHRFDASPQMYKAQFKKWKLYKNESSQLEKRRTDDTPTESRKRARAATSLDERPEESPNVLFDRGRNGDKRSGWAGDRFRLIPPNGCQDHFKEWKAVADQSHGASALIRLHGGPSGKYHGTLHIVFKDIDKLVKQDDPWMLVYLWRVILYLRGISFRVEHHKSSYSSISRSPQNGHLVGHVITGVAYCIANNHGREHYMARCLHSLRSFSLHDMKLAIEQVYVFRFLKYWPGEVEKDVLPSYKKLVCDAEAKFGRNHQQTITFLTEYMYTAHYHGHDSVLTHRLASDLWRRTGDPRSVLSWGPETYAHVLATKLLARIDKDRGSNESWEKRLHDVARKLRNGDRECQTRALQLRGTMAQWYEKAGMVEQAQRETEIADEIKNYMRVVATEQHDWSRNWTFGRSEVVM
ncbi:uncharacterized protein CTRU02_211366 [Colletotrichum truncatum]|uniref:Uncharacterized protein n=1 Tax=Colletotrichum truncatum TaxID=5467 RepID=A0ACC3YRU7_COLTU